MSDTSFLYRPGALTDIGVDDPEGRVAAVHGPALATPALAAVGVGVAICYAMLNAFEAGKTGGPLHPPMPD
ncbi:hypothetical protein AB0B45_31955 [Nonomuraea sp. NPDC049152]|uniref:hypothetical protein n=1 Tax=Nonomuraea sp. NPDC049152 TaxID=3154350 RepID=UPI0033F8CF73